MRTLIITLIGLITTLNLTAQSSSDTTYSKEWDAQIESWVNFDRIISTYENHHLSTELIQVYNDCNWVNYNLRTLFYNNDLVVEEIEKYWNDREEAWTDNYRKLYQYNASGNPVQITHQYIFNGNYVNSSREILKYSESGKLIEKTVENFEEAWSQFLKYQYYFNAKDLLIEENLTYWNGKDWDDPAFTLKYTYDKDNNLVSKVKTKKRGHRSLNLIKEEYVYNEGGRLEKQNVYDWNQSKRRWANKNRAVYVNDLNGYVCSMMNQNKDKREWINYLLTEFKGDNEPVTGLDIAEGMTFTVYPVNFGKQAKIEFDNPYNEEYMVRVLNNDGKLVGSAVTDKNEVAIDARHMIKGTYYVELQGSNLYSGKFSIE